MANNRTKFVLDEERIPRAWYNIAADLPSPQPPALHPGTMQPLGPGRSRAALPDGAHRAGGQHGAGDRDPRAGPRRLPPVPAQPALPRPPAGEGARYARPHLLQVRGPEPGRQPQAEHGDPAGVLQRRGRRQAPRNRDRRWPVGDGPLDRRGAVRPRGQGLHGPCELRPEAVSPDADGGVRRLGRGKPVTDHELRAGRARGDPGQPGIARDGDQRGGRGRRHARRHEVRAGVRAQPRPAPPDGGRPGGDPPDGDGRRGAGRRDRAALVAGRTSVGSRSRSWGGCFAARRRTA